MGGIPYLSFKPLVYGYSFARVRAKYKFMLSRQFIDELLGLNTIDEIIAKLEETSYKPDLVSLSLGASKGTLIDIATGRNFSNLLSQIMGFTPEMAKPVLETYLDIYTVHNLVALLRSLGSWDGAADPGLKHYSFAFMPAGGIDASKFEQFNRQELDTSLHSLRGSPYGRMVYEEYRRCGKNEQEFLKNIEFLAARLYSAYYKSIPGKITLSETDAVKLRKLMALRMEAQDIMLLLRALKRNVPFDRITGYLVLENRKYESYYNMGKSDFGGLMKELDRAYKLEAYERYAKDKMLSFYEIAFEQRFARLSAGIFRQSVLSLGSILGYIFIKEQEVMNIRKIAWGKLMRIKKESIAEMLVFSERMAI
ncbi:hypothetical protein COT30_00370 [Candidatus Micrarchaeota archaeon CG08_land_8_20_14_0_20_49_17]|nr:MAG: hypothetical protein AUJ13_04375 [Candidatus Micrarchaeota archaeon CG1_02_49_24]PIU10236.1 MAG: hypothetical protein COT30_00370 [Candidatus Micrarchaeota archaeon CG08_land_8_20_14_0_20_49_17]PIZ96990.1 MAG: hypothetical protein COX84_03510 [Candidatus Micrarchaeota archaeon CG_4_10_14_0_2_um_filter_49_7]HII54142.1 hypothetical protein [Candidatus Micrarchaeota archaeon]